MKCDQGLNQNCIYQNMSRITRELSENRESSRVRSRIVQNECHESTQKSNVIRANFLSRLTRFLFLFFLFCLSHPALHFGISYKINEKQIF